MANFSERLKALRIVAHLSQEELSRKLQVSRSCIGNYEQGKRTPSIEDLEKIADYFNVDMNYLLGKSDTEKMAKFDLITDNERFLLETYRRDPNIKDIIDRMLKYVETAQKS